MAEKQPTFEPYRHFASYTDEEMLRRAREFEAFMAKRHTVRDFSSKPVPEDVLKACLAAALTAPSSTNAKPWHFVAVRDQELKKKIREKAETEEESDFSRYVPISNFDIFSPFGTSGSKPFLEEAPVLIAVFAETKLRQPDGKLAPRFYARESVCIATGILLTAIHHAGLVALPHTPQPMAFLNDMLDRPETEEPILILLVGFPGEHARALQSPEKPFVNNVTLR